MTEATDKTQWPAGPWNQEPDRMQWQHAGYVCLARRHMVLGHWCGYVGVDSSHPYYNKHYVELDDSGLEVHGGLTYSEPPCDDICHTPEPGMPADVWWLGFDCAHVWDVSPGVPELYRSRLNETEYRDLAYVQSETNHLAAQLREAAT